MKTKIAAEQIDGLMVKAAHTIRTQQARISHLEGQLAGKERHEHAEKIASAAVDKGIMDPTDADEYAQTLAAGDKDLDMVEDFVSQTVVGVSLGESLQKVASVEGADGDTPEDAFVNSLMSSEFV